MGGDKYLLILRRIQSMMWVFLVLRVNDIFPFLVLLSKFFVLVLSLDAHTYWLSTFS